MPKSLSRDGLSDDPKVVNGIGNPLLGKFQEMKQQKQFKHLPEDSMQVIDRSQSRDLSQDPSIICINSIVLQLNLGDSRETALVVLAKDAKIDLDKVKEFWKEKYPSLVSVNLAPSDQLESLVGYRAGCVPPIGHSKVLPTILDAAVIQDTPRRLLLGGGGHEEFYSLVRLATLVGMNHVNVAKVAEDDEQDEVITENDENIVISPRVITLPIWGSETRPKPLFPVETPDIEQAQLWLQDPLEDVPSLPAMTWVTLVGHISSVRRLSKRLVFCDLMPPGYHDEETGKLSKENDNENEGTKPWRSATDGKDFSVQLIGGTTICNALGEVQGQAALKGLQAGQIVLVQAKINVYNSRDSLERWASHRRLDLVLVTYKVLHHSPNALPPVQGAAPQTQQFSRKPNKPYLRWEDLLIDKDAMGNNRLNFITLVEDMKSLEGFSRDVLKLLDAFETSEYASESETKSADDLAGKNGATSNYAFVGIDCEWKPGFYLDNPLETQPVLLLQISIHDQVYLLDLQSLARPLQALHDAMTPAEQLLNDTIEKIFLSNHLFKVGFQVVQDLQRLAVSYPQIPAFQEVSAVLDAAALATKVVRLRRQKNAKLLTSSLSRLTEHFLGRSVNKDQQVSDWSARPLTRDQLEYAALDAMVTPFLVRQFFEELDLSVFLPGPEMGRWIGDAPYGKLLASFKFLFLPRDADVSVMKRLKAKSILSNQPLLVVTQSWTTAEVAPKLPSVEEDDNEGPYTDVFGIVQVPSTSIQIGPKRPVEGQASNVSSLVGRRAGKSKEMCLLNLLAATVVNYSNILPEGARLQYPGRSGYVEFDDGVALFVNMPERISANSRGTGQPRSFPNIWMEEGRMLTWFLRDYDWLSGTTTLAKKLLDPSSLIVLFVRVLNKSYFLCCGPCQVVLPETKTDIIPTEKQESWKLVQLNLILTEWETLVTSSDFLSLQ